MYCITPAYPKAAPRHRLLLADIRLNAVLTRQD